MRRRSGYWEDRIGDQVAAAGLADDLAWLLRSLKEDDARILAQVMGLDGPPRSYAEIAQGLGTSALQIRQRLGLAFSRLRHPSRTARMHDYLDIEDLSALLARPLPRPQIVQCPRHGWVPHAELRCGQCPCGLYPLGHGRPPRYCSDACRMAAYRQRRRHAEPPWPVLGTLC